MITQGASRALFFEHLSNASVNAHVMGSLDRVQCSLQEALEVRVLDTQQATRSASAQLAFENPIADR